MKRTTVFMDESLDHDLHTLAARKGMPVAELLREAVGRYLAEETRREPLSLRFLAAGHSGRKNISSSHESLLWCDLSPHERRGRGSRKP